MVRAELPHHLTPSRPRSRSSCCKPWVRSRTSSPSPSCCSTPPRATAPSLAWSAPRATADAPHADEPWPGERALRTAPTSRACASNRPRSAARRSIKTYTFKRGSYAIGVKHEVSTLGAPRGAAALLQLVRERPRRAAIVPFAPTFTGPALYTDKAKFQKVEFKDIEKGKLDFEKSASDGWVAMVQHYFTSAWLHGGDAKREFFANKVAGTGGLYLRGGHALQPARTGARRQRAQEDIPLPARRKRTSCSPGAGPGAGEGLRHLLHPVQAAVLAAGQTARHSGQLGLGHRRAGRAAQDRLLLAQRQRLPQHGQDEGRGPAHQRDARAPEGQAAGDAGRR